MRTSTGLSSETSDALSTGRSMWIDPDRIFYAGLLGAPTVRGLGAFVVYVSAGAPFNIAMGDGGWHGAELAVTPPYAPHRIISADRLVYQILVEPETIDHECLPDFMRGAGGAIDAPHLAARMREACRSIQKNGYGTSAADFDFDQCFFDEQLPGSKISGSIAKIVSRIKDDPANNIPGESCADAVHLSLSRFLHRFKQEVGVSFRDFRTWQRARKLMHFVGQNHNLAYLALDMGYPDSTHFSHSVRRIYGMRPRDIFAGSRALELYCKSTQGSYTAVMNSARPY